jgi:predicted ribosome quality control (RQC) complex YloA/Tae2 family protein
MAFDGIVISSLANELDKVLKGGKIDKIYQPEKDTLVMGVRTYGASFRLLMCANPSCARVHLSNRSMENPQSPPMLCMLMRKHLTGGKITKIVQPDFERIIEIYIECVDELGRMNEKIIVCEIMGKHSNIIFLDHNLKVIDSVYRIDDTVSSVRNILPGIIYTPPPPQDKTNPCLADKDEIKNTLSRSDIPLFKQIMDSYKGISPLISREAVFRACSFTDKSGEEVTEEEFDKTAYIFSKMIENTVSGEINPCVVKDKTTGKLIDFNALSITQFEGEAQVLPFDTINEASEFFFSQKAATESLKQKSGDLMKFVNTSLERCRKKLQIENETLEKAKNKDKYKIYGDLITANIYRITQGLKHIECENFYSEKCEKIIIPLKDDLSPSKNAQRYYTKYNKEKTAEKETLKQKELNLKEIDYLESVKEAIEIAESGAEIALIREELVREGYLKNRGARKQNKKASLPTPMHFVSDDGYDIYVGKNNTQNDYVTLKLSRSTDIWFHTKSIHGSHAIVRTPDAMDVPERTYIQAASLAAYYSKARNSKSVAVDYTEVKNVKKPSGAKPGMVIYVNYNTIYTDPDEELSKRLRAD